MLSLLMVVFLSLYSLDVHLYLMFVIFLCKVGEDEPERKRFCGEDNAVAGGAAAAAAGSDDEDRMVVDEGGPAPLPEEVMSWHLVSSRSFQPQPKAINRD